MTGVAFDTLKLATALRDRARLTQEQAEGFATAIGDALHDDLATKSDLAATQADILLEFGQVRREIEAMKADTRLEFSQVRREIEAVKADILKWMFGAIGFQTVVVVGAILALVRFQHGS